MLRHTRLFLSQQTRNLIYIKHRGRQSSDDATTRDCASVVLIDSTSFLFLDSPAICSPVLSLDGQRPDFLSAPLFIITERALSLCQNTSRFFTIQSKNRRRGASAFSSRENWRNVKQMMRSCTNKGAAIARRPRNKRNPLTSLCRSCVYYFEMALGGRVNTLFPKKSGSF